MTEPNATRPSTPRPVPAPTPAPPPTPTVAQSQADDPALFDRRIVAGKEIISGCLALLIVGTTLVVALTGVAWAGAAEAFSRAKDVLVILTGLAGVVLGYYFGRVPAEARAAQAQTQAQAAQKDALSARAEAEAANAAYERTREAVASVLRSAPRELQPHTDEGFVIGPEQLRELEDALRR